MKQYIILDNVTDDFLVLYKDGDLGWDNAYSYEYGYNRFLDNIDDSALFSTKKEGNKVIKELTKLFLEHDKNCEIDFKLIDCKPKTIYVVH